MSLEKRGILLQQIAKYGSEGISKDLLKKKLGWSDDEFNVAWQQAISEKEIDPLPNGCGRLSDRLKGQVPELDAGEPVQSDRPPLQFNIGSFVGVLNTGEMKNVESIRVSVANLEQSGNLELAQAFSKLTEAIAKSTELTEKDREESLDQLQELSRQAALPPEKRARPGIIKAVLKVFGECAKAAGGLAEVWHTWGEPIRKFFGY